jgi:hypothetical protein
VSVRATEDLDIFIRATPENVERLKRAFRAAYGGDPSGDEISAVDLLGDYPAVRYYPPSGGRERHQGGHILLGDVRPR